MLSGAPECFLRALCFFVANSYATKRRKMRKNRSRTLVGLSLLRLLRFFAASLLPRRSATCTKN